MGLHAYGVEHFSGPLPPVRSLRRATTLSSAKLITVAPPACAIVKRSGTLSMAMTCCAPSRIRAANRHLSDRPATPDRDSVRGLNVALHSRLPTGRKDVAEEQHLLVGEASRGYLDVGLIGVRNADIFCLAAGISPREMGVSEQARRRVAKHLVRDLPVPV